MMDDDMENIVGACGVGPNLSMMSENRKHKERGEERVASGDGHGVFKIIEGHVSKHCRFTMHGIGWRSRKQLLSMASV